MKTENLGLIATIITLVYTLLGLPAQIWKNHQMQSVEGMSLFMCLMLFATFSSWIIYGFKKGDRYIIVSNVSGGIGVVIILIQFILYSK